MGLSLKPQQPHRWILQPAYVEQINGYMETSHLGMHCHLTVVTDLALMLLGLRIKRDISDGARSFGLCHVQQAMVLYPLVEVGIIRLHGKIE